MTARNFDKDIEIDLLALHSEWQSQPSHFHHYSRLLAESNDRLRRLKERLDVARAELSADIRKNPAVYQCEKITEGIVADTLARCLGDGNKFAVTLADNYRRINKEYLDAMYEVDMVTASVKAFEQRKTALENEVKLFGQNYFAGPHVPYEIGAEFKKTAEAMGRDVARDAAAGAMREGGRRERRFEG